MVISRKLFVEKVSFSCNLCGGLYLLLAKMYTRYHVPFNCARPKHVHRTPILRSAEGATDTAVEQRLPREPVGEKHPLALPRVKQRERRAVQLLGRRRVDPSRDATATPTTVDSDESMKLDGIDRSGKDPVSALSPQSSSSGTLGKGKTVISEDRTRMVSPWTR